MSEFSSWGLDTISFDNYQRISGAIDINHHIIESWNVTNPGASQCITQNESNR